MRRLIACIVAFVLAAGLVPALALPTFGGGLLRMHVRMSDDVPSNPVGTLGSETGTLSEYGGSEVIGYASPVSRATRETPNAASRNNKAATIPNAGDSLQPVTLAAFALACAMIFVIALLARRTGNLRLILARSRTNPHGARR